jgi:hypothetical protein
MQAQRKSKPTTEQLPRIDRAGARRLIASAGPDVSRDIAHQWGGAARAWFIKTSSWHAIVVYGAVLAGVMTASLEGPQHAWSSGGLLVSPPDSGAGSKEFTMMKKMSAAGVAAVMIASQTVAGDAVQWRVEDGGNGHWYALSVVGPIAWPLANSAAATRGGHLATLTSESEKSFAKAVIAATPGYGESAVRRWGPWLGAYQDRKAADYSEPVGGWRWVTGEVWDFAAWSQNQPDNWCAETQVQEEFLTIAGGDLQGNGAWNDIPADGCDNDPVISYVIEWSADCNNDGIIDFGQCRDGSLPDTNTNNIPDCCEQGVSCNNVDPCASQTVLFVDDFEAPALDSLKWDVRLPYACSLVQQGGGEVLMQARGHLVTRGEFSPRSGAIRLEYTFRYIAGVEAFEVNMLTNGDISGTCCSQPNNGIAFVMASWNEPTMAFVIGSANLQITNVVHSGSITVSMGDTFHVNLELTSTAIHADIRKKGSPLQSMSVSATWAGTPLGTKVAFYDRELCDARSAISKVSISRFGADCDSDGTTDACEIASGAPDINHNNIPDTCECIGDIYVDGIIDGGDLGVLLAYWGPTTSAATSIACDLNVDGVVSGSDLGILLAYWGPCSN